MSDTSLDLERFLRRLDSILPPSSKPFSEQINDAMPYARNDADRKHSLELIQNVLANFWDIFDLDQFKNPHHIKAIIRSLRDAAEEIEAADCRYGGEPISRLAAGANHEQR